MLVTLFNVGTVFNLPNDCDVEQTDNSSDVLTLLKLKLVLTLMLVPTWLLVPTWMLVPTSALKVFVHQNCYQFVQEIHSEHNH